jgi:predicted nucleotidyltransferase
MTPDILRAIHVVHEAAHETGVTPILVGALVTGLAAERDTYLPVPRRTQDADFAVRVDGWPSFRQFRKSLVRRGATQDPRIEHRLSIGAAVVDLLPYGPGVTTSGVILPEISTPTTA